jgi:hypothetical protein
VEKLTSDELTDAVLRLKIVLARRRAGLANLHVKIAEASLAMHRLGVAFRAAEQREVDALLFEHPDMVALDMADAYWRPETT